MICLQSSNVLSPLGWTLRENLEALKNGRGGIAVSTDNSLSDQPLPLSRINRTELDERFSDLAAPNGFTAFEKAAILSAREALGGSAVDVRSPHTGLVLSTTKGNVELLEDPGAFGKDRMMLGRTAEIIARQLGFTGQPWVVSNACISGVLALLLAQRLILSGLYRNVVVIGADVISRFIVSGFQSFLSLSARPCAPFDKDRDGLTLGEAAATAVLGSEEGYAEMIAGASSNDANHISGPSRTGEGLFLAMRDTLSGQKIPGLISAHGTATLYNDEMESKAIERAGLSGIPVNSLKGYFGHTLGAAGLVESLSNLEALKGGFILPTMGYKEHGVSVGIRVPTAVEETDQKVMLKLSSGFGGCNAAAMFRIL